MTKPWIENDELARAQFEVGWRWQRYVGDFFAAHDLPVELPPLKIRQSVDQIDEFADEWDLKVAGERIEVKSRDLIFSSNPRSFPHPTALVDTVSGYDAHEKKPRAYIFVSQKTGSLLATPSSQKECDAFWSKTVKSDRVRNINGEVFYETPRSRLTSIERVLARLQAIHASQLVCSK